LMDGGFVTSPSVGFMDTDGEFGVENVGVTPDIEVEQTPAEVIKGHDPQLEAAVKAVMDELAKNPIPKLKKKDFPRGR
jgi:tricorn protease